MKKLFIIFIVLFSFTNSDAQVLQDTIDFSNVVSNYAIFNNSPALKTVDVHFASTLFQKGIVPGMTIYGIAYRKKNNVTLNTGATALLDIKYKTGDVDSIIPVYIPSISVYGSSIGSSMSYYMNNIMFSGYTGYMQYSTTANNLSFPADSIWIPFMLDAPFVYTGGCLKIFTDWQSNASTFTGNPYFSATGPSVSQTFFANFCTILNNSCNNIYYNNSRYSLIIYHSPAPQACNSMPLSGGITGNQYVCVGKDFHLYLLNPSAGPGIAFQWQKTPIGSGSWADIAGATNTSLSYNFPAATPTNFRCKVTCTNSGQSAYTNPFPLYPFAVHIDSVAHSITNNVLSVHCFSNDTSFSIVGVRWNFGDSSNIYYYGNQVAKTYTKDGSYTVKVIWQSDCCADSLTFPVTIGCAGSTTFNNTISAFKDSTCLGSPETLQINDTLPNNYTVEWYRFTWSGNILLGTTTTGSYNVPVAAPSDIFWTKAICNISGNFKYSNYDTVWVTPPPIAGTIQALNTTTNYYNFTNSGMSNAQTYKWHFGDGDSSSSLAPSHHYNLAGTYNVWFVVTNAGNGCTDTAFTTVHITTGIEETQSKLFSVSPNPFNESFVVNCPSGKGTITVTDAVGKEIVRLSLSKPFQTIDLKGYTSGVYLIKYENDNESETIKIMKQ